MRKPDFIYFIFIAGTMSIISIFGCFRKSPSPPENIQDWLDAHWEGRFKVVASVTNFTDKEYYLNKRKSVIADAGDNEVQFILPWMKGQADMGVTTEQVEESLARSQADAAKARALFQQLKTAGLDSASVGMHAGVISVMLFQEPLPDVRGTKLQAVVEVLSKTPEVMPCVLYFMEDTVYGQEFQDIIPVGHWVRRDSWQTSMEIMSLVIPDDLDETRHAKPGKWRFNTSSSRASTYIDKAFAAAHEWAKSRTPANTTLGELNLMEIGLSDQDGLKVEISFPYFENPAETEEKTISGMISGVYNIDKDTFEQIHITKVDFDQ